MKNIIILFVGFLYLSSFNTPKPEQFVKTQLRVTVIDNLGNIVKDAKVRLFLKEEDYKKEVNAVGMAESNEKGIASFNDLQDRVYYVLVEKGDMNNWGGGNVTDRLTPKRVNKINIIIE